MIWDGIPLDILIGLVSNGLFDRGKEYTVNWTERPEGIAKDLKGMDLERTLLRSFLLAQIAVINAALETPALPKGDRQLLEGSKKAFVVFASGLEQIDFPGAPIRKIEDVLRVLQHRVRPATDLELIAESLLLQAYRLFPDAPEGYLRLLGDQLLPQFLHFFERELKEGKKAKQLLDMQMQGALLFEAEQARELLMTLQRSVETLAERALGFASLDRASLEAVQEGVRLEVRTAVGEIAAHLHKLKEQNQVQHATVIQILTELLKRSDRSLPSRTEPGPVVMNTPAVPDHFADRDRLLERIHEILGRKPGLKAVHLWGMGGIGKTTLAAAYVSRFGSESTHRLWFDLEGGGMPDLQTFLKQAGGYESGMKTDEIRQAVRNWLGSNEDWLLVLNGVTQTEDVGGLLPAGYRGALIVTSRDRWLYAEGEAMQVQELDERASVQYLMDATGHPNRDGATRLARRLAGYPLMLEMAAAYLKEEWAESEERGDSFDQYLQLLDRSPKAALEGHERLSRYPHSLGAVFETSLQRVKDGREPPCPGTGRLFGPDRDRAGLAH